MKFDFRSDTVTKPTDKMRNAMMNALVGDDVYEDDPTVNELEKYATELFNVEAALFVPSGTFSNQVAIMTHTNRGDEIITEDHAHIKIYEVGAAAALSGVNIMSLPSVKGMMDLSVLEDTIRGLDVHFPTTKLICLENAYNGMALPLEYMKSVKDIADKHGILMHLDGARVFNAATSLGVDVKEITKYFDSISVCLSKGLCSPIGSILLGKTDFIKKARRNRKMMGGGMRQVGVLAAPALISLKEMTLRLNEDHLNANFLANELDKIECITVDKEKLEINMVFLEIKHNNIELLINKLEENEIIIGGYQKGLRLAVHNDITKDSIVKLVKIFKEMLK